MILVWSRKAIAKSSRTRRSCRETEEPVNNWLLPKFGNLHSLQLSRDLQQFLFFDNWLRPRLTSLLSIGYVVCFPLATCPSPVLWAYASATITEFSHVHRWRWYSDIFDRMHLFQHPPYSQHQWAWWHFGNHLVHIILEQMQLSQNPPIHRNCGNYDISVITPVLSICQQHPPYSHPQVTLIYYTDLGLKPSLLDHWQTLYPLD